MNLFPIQTKTACRLKWSWSTLYLNDGMTASCHRASWSKVSVENFQNFHNTEEKLQARKLMLDGVWPEGGCEYCRRIEEANGESDRMFQNQIPDVYPEELKADPKLIRVQPRVLEVFFRNTCNLACLYCREGLSSRIQAENRKFSYTLESLRGIQVKNEEAEEYNTLVRAFWEWLDKNSNTLLRLNILGGEPLIQEEVFQLIDFFKKNPNPSLELSIVTNLMVPLAIQSKFVSLAEDLMANNCVSRVEILVSVEGLGPEQEYVRYGFNTKQFLLNFENLLSSNIRLGILSTINILAISALPELAKQFLKWNTKREVYWYAHSVIPHDDEDLLSLSHYPTSWYQQYIKEAILLLPDNTWDLIQIRKALVGILNKSNSLPKEQKKIGELFHYLDEVDLRRGLNWKKIFKFR